MDAQATTPARWVRALLFDPCWRVAEYSRLAACVLATALLTGLGSAQEAQPVMTPAATPTPTPTPIGDQRSDEMDWERLRTMSREERIREHQARIQRIIEENRRRQAEEQQRQAEAQKTPQPPGQPTPAPPPPGQPLPAGPVTQATPAPPGAPPAQPAAVPKTVRSEARSLLFLRPFDTVVNVGETFQTEVILDTKEGAADRVTFRLRYPKTRLNPLALDFRPVLDLVDGEVEVSQDREAGELFARIPLAEARPFKAEPVARIIWEALSPTDSVPIKFTFGSGQTTGVYLRGSQLLGTEGQEGDGVIDGSVMIVDRKARPVVQKAGEKGLLVASTAVSIPPATMSLRLETDRKAVREGDEFVVDVILDNPRGAPLDRVRLYIQFDPKSLEVVDWDRGNWIREGINIYDGFARQVFAFDFHKANMADNQRGNIIYDMGTELVPLRSDGPLARIKFRALRAAERTDVVLAVNDPGVAPTTDVTYRQVSMLRDRPTEMAALDGVAMRVAADEAGRRKLAASRARNGNSVPSEQEPAGITIR